MKPIEITDQMFEKEVLDSPIPVLVDFWAPWCGPCRIVTPILEELSGEFEGKIKFVKVNVDENAQYAGQFGVQSIPNMKLFKQGSIVDEIIGAAPKPSIKGVIEKYAE